MSRWGGAVKVSFLSRAAEITVSRYGVPRYHGERLVRVLLSDRLYGNQGGTTDSLFVPEIAIVCSLRAFFIAFLHEVRKDLNL